MSSGWIAVFATGSGALLALSSCGSTTNGVDRRDCPSDVPSGTGGSTSGGGGGSSGSGGSSGTSGRSGNAGTTGASGTGGRAGASGAAGASADSGAAGASTTCDGSKTPDVESCVISDDYGLFVSPTGDDTSGDGSEATPYATLTMALTKADTVKRIYVCAAEYTEPRTLEIPGGISIYGGFSCDGGAWTYDSVNNKASFKPQSPIGAEIKNGSGVSLTDLSITAMDATGPGGNSFGLMVIDGGVSLTRVEIRAGSGAIGSAGVDGLKGADGADATSDQNGKRAVCDGASKVTGGTLAALSACQVGGGDGGTGYNNSVGDPGMTGVPLDNIVAEGVRNGGPAAATTGAAVAGQRGGDGSSGLSGVTGASAPLIGTFSTGGYAVASGGDGTDGFPGQGGGGGGASFGNNNCTGASGGAGGMGGCGGTHATGGRGGGASVAVFSWNSSVKLVSASLVASNGGAGGKGGKAGIGGAGKSGGQGGAADGGNGIGKGGNGGDGGLGGNGGNGTGGTGGPSIAIVYSTMEPVIDEPSTLTVGAGGLPGAGGTYGNPNTKAADGNTGLVKDQYKVP